MNFQQLEYILAVHQLKHFGKAADRCNVTQATLSAMIKKLEEELNLLIFDRSRHPIQTTEEGLEVLKIAKEILIKQQDIYQLTNKEGDLLEGELRLGIIPTIANTLLPLILAPLIEQHPGLKLTISEITTDEIIHQLRQNQIDIGLLSTPIDAINLDEQFEEQILYYEAMMVYGISSPDMSYVSSKDIESKKVWLLEEGHCFREQSMTLCKIQEKKEKSENIQFKSNSFDTLLHLSDQMGGLTLIPELYAKGLSAKKKKLTKSFQSPIPVREISLLALKPVLKKNSMSKIANLIQTIVKPRLIANQYKNKDLNIIGI